MGVFCINLFLLGSSYVALVSVAGKFDLSKLSQMPGCLYLQYLLQCRSGLVLYLLLLSLKRVNGKSWLRKTLADNKKGEVIKFNNNRLFNHFHITCLNKWFPHVFVI